MFALPALLLAGLTTTGAAGRPEVSLRYERGPGAERCPDDEALRRAVSARLGYDPFREGAPRVIEARIGGEDSGLVGLLEVTEGGAPRGKRQLRSPGTDCVELSGALELSIAIAIDPLASRPRLPLTTEPEPSGPVPVEAPLPPRVGPDGFAAAGFGGSVGAAPGPTAGVELAAGARWPWWSLSLEGRADLGASLPVGQGAVSGGLLFATLAPCGHFSRFGGCLLIAGGGFRAASSGLADSRQETAPFAALGARFLAELRIADRLTVVPHADLLAPLVRTSLWVGTEPVWRLPLLSVAVGARLSVRFP
jgi:hypothetical protein